ncbi:MAG: zinc-ribbon domain-containing protein [Coriobacteriales bacterium]
MDANKCPNCGADLLIGASTCRECGYKIEGGFSVAAGVAAPQPLKTAAPESKGNFKPPTAQKPPTGQKPPTAPKKPTPPKPPASGDKKDPEPPSASE